MSHIPAAALAAAARLASFSGIVGGFSPPISSLSKEPSLRRNQRKFVALHSGARRSPYKTRRVFPRAAAAVVPSAPVARGWLVPCRLCALHLAPTKAPWRPGRACHWPCGTKRETQVVQLARPVAQLPVCPFQAPFPSVREWRNGGLGGSGMLRVRSSCRRIDGGSGCVSRPAGLPASNRP